MMKNPLQKYRRQFSVLKFWNKLRHYARMAGIKVAYTGLLLFYAYKRKETPPWARRIIIGTLGYFLAPIDALPDLTPIIGYTDDLGILSFGLVTIAGFINGEVKENAREKLKKWFGEYDLKQLAEIDKKL